MRLATATHRPRLPGLLACLAAALLVALAVPATADDDRDRVRGKGREYSERYEDRHDDRRYDRRYDRRDDRRHRGDHRWDRGRRDHRDRWDRGRDRHRHDRYYRPGPPPPRYHHRGDRHRGHRFSVPRVIVEPHVYQPYYRGRIHHAPHHHHHAVYWFPVIYQGYETYRPHYYCEGKLFSVGGHLGFGGGGLYFDFRF